jgi:hypothetical protein
MKPECNRKILFNHVEEYFILNVGDPVGRAKMEVVPCVYTKVHDCIVV